ALPRSIDVELLPGIRAQLDTHDATQRGTYWQGSRFEHPTAGVLKDWSAQPGAVFFDMGSNYGWFSFFLASELPGLPIYPFEPNPPTFDRLRTIVERNALRNIHPCNFGLGDRAMTSRLRIGVEDSGHSTFGPHPGLSEQNSVEVAVRPFDEWRRESGMALPVSSAWVAKIDVEGFECRVIAGMREALEARAFRGLAIEVNPYTLEFCGDSQEKLSGLLKDLGYVEREPAFPGQHLQMNKFFVPCA
ncbi:MAG: FkbM family methyltransferase, partial [Chthoniobacterales bacterium]